MGNLRIALLIILLSTTYTTQQDYPNRPTRTLGSFFGSSTKPSPSPPVPTQTRGANNNSPAAQTSKQVPGGGVRPLVYQVKYYERNNNGLVDYPVDSRNYVVDSKVVGAEPVQYVGAPVVPQPTTNRFVYYNPLIPPQTPPQTQPYGFYPTTPIEPYGYPYQQVSPYVLPCAHTQNPTDLIYENSVVPQTTVTMNMQPVVAQTQQTPDKVVVPTPTIRAPVVEPQAQRYHHHPVPLVREQVVQAAAELSGAVPTTGVVGSGINAVPYGYYYYYYIPPLPPQQQYYRIQGSSQQQQQQPSQYVPYVVSPYGQPVVQQQVKTQQQQGSVVGQRVVGAQQVQQQGQGQGQGVVKEQQK